MLESWESNTWLIFTTALGHMATTGVQKFMENKDHDKSRYGPSKLFCNKHLSVFSWIFKALLYLLHIYPHFSLFSFFLFLSSVFVSLSLISILTPGNMWASLDCFLGTAWVASKHINMGDNSEHDLLSIGYIFFKFASQSVTDLKLKNIFFG